MPHRLKKKTQENGEAARDALFFNVEFRDQYARLEEDPRIGPSAPGDGDIVRWVYLAIGLLLMDFREADKERPFRREDPNPPGAIPAKKEGLFASFRWMGLTLLYAAYESEAQVPHVAWLDRYEMLGMDFHRLWGGRRVRVHKTSKKIDPERMVKEALQAGARISDIPERTGVSRATMYRILKRANK
jgi:hypothetical protein